MARLFGALNFLFILLFFSCNDDKTVKQNDIDPGLLYFDYQVFGTEGDSLATILIQFKIDGPLGATVLLDTSGRVELDGQPIYPDSTKMTGPFYELRKPLKSLTGTHAIQVFNSTGKYREEFSF